ncbi:7 transmembrane sweet-taste receptor of 3 GCPR-domain-containing protein [Globomyces pollinis-pini]|nr:7 transmembrane sweet-taste receptor of 3 GCPR-domain-containing protein [Globomyces pollinis-pini]
MISGCVLALLGLILSSGKPTATSCMIAPWLGATAMSVTIGGLLVKTIRVYIIFTNPFKAKTLPLQDSHLFIAVGILTVLEMIILAIWTALDPLKPTLSPQVTFQNLVCDSGSIGATLGNILFGFNGVLIFMGVVMAVMTRNVVSNYNESTHIGICMYTMFISFLILLALPQLKSSNVAIPYIVSAVTIIFTIITLVGVLIVSKLFTKEEEEGYKQIGSPTNTGIMGTSFISKFNNHNDPHHQPMTNCPEPIIINCQYRFASSTSMLMFANWKQSELCFDSTISLLCFSNTSKRTQLEGRCGILTKKDIKDVKFESLGEDIHQVSCAIGYNVWQIQMRSSNSAKALENALKTLK